MIYYETSKKKYTIAKYIQMIFQYRLLLIQDKLSTMW